MASSNISPSESSLPEYSDWYLGATAGRIGVFVLFRTGVECRSLGSSDVRSMTFAGGSFRAASSSDSELDSIIFRVVRCLRCLLLDCSQDCRLFE